LVSFSEVTRFHDRQDVLRDVTLSIEPGERIGLVGRNGAGKTTIIRMIMDMEAPDSGQISKTKGLRLGYLPQDVMEHSNDRLLSLVLDSDPRWKEVEAELKAIDRELESSSSLSQEELVELVEKQGRLHHQFDSMGGWARESEGKKILSGLGFSESDFDRPLGEFSGGWVMRAILARLLLSSPDLLVLDEPTNHLDLDSLMWLEAYLKSAKSALLLVSHDRVFLNNVSEKIIELRNCKAFAYSGNYDFFVNEKAKRMATETAAFENQQERIKQLERFIERNKSRASTAKRAQSRVKVLERLDKLAQPGDGTEASFRLKLPRGRRGPDVVASFSHVAKRYGETQVYKDLSLTLLKGQRLALLGPNGRGKTTLARLLAGLVNPDSGEIRLGQNVDIGYFSQFQMESLDPNLNLLEELGKVAGNLTPGPLRTILGGFLFSGDDVFKKVSVLSGGEKTRLVLAKIMMTAPNLLIMDEPTNHLDIPGRQMLEDALSDYEGSLVLISHDRHFINRLCDRVGVIEEGKLVVYPGNFDDYQRLRLKTPPGSQKSPSPLAYEAPPALAAAESPANRKSQPAEKTEGPAGRKKAALARKEAAVRRKPYLAALSKAETRLEEIDRRLKAIEEMMCQSAVYQDGAKVKALTAELSSLKSQRLEEEKSWETATVELERLDSEEGAESGRASAL
jgi:ATP-binding cassette subfamily F protein 3